MRAAASTRFLWISCSQNKRSLSGWHFKCNKIILLKRPMNFSVDPTRLIWAWPDSILSFETKFTPLSLSLHWTVSIFAGISKTSFGHKHFDLLLFGHCEGEIMRHYIYSLIWLNMCQQKTASRVQKFGFVVSIECSVRGGVSNNDGWSLWYSRVGYRLTWLRRGAASV